MRCAIFIDGAYLEKILKNEFSNPSPPKIDFGKLSEELRQNIPILRTYYYNCLPYQSNPPTDDERTRFSGRQKFYTTLERLPHYQVKQGKIVFRGHDYSKKPILNQKGVDVLLSIDMTLLAARKQITQAILVAGDSDFIPAVNAVKDLGITVTLYHSANRTSYHQELWQACDDRIAITKPLIDKVRLGGH